jgi:hypothetical protein
VQAYRYNPTKSCHKQQQLKQHITQASALLLQQHPQRWHQQPHLPAHCLLLLPSAHFLLLLLLLLTSALLAAVAVGSPSPGTC